ncbi:excisionase [Paramagnetospirillum caucaseum]|uniref:Excisionase n=1 Tax=Paramagnetospirillum caucaseum TaxID=1244869 RepID=M3A811_9PROT|nr:helix-turn-helix domain-containing protein [Paramagnetospirillum caucaseum]EME68609.1 excisionase [Paramagnetospirillum caucaseum]
MSKANSTDSAKRAFSIPEYCKLYGIGRTSAYREITDGRLKVVKCGGRTLIPADEAERWLASLSA